MLKWDVDNDADHSCNVIGVARCSLTPSPTPGKSQSTNASSKGMGQTC